MGGDTVAVFSGEADNLVLGIQPFCEDGVDKLAVGGFHLEDIGEFGALPPRKGKSVKVSQFHGEFRKKPKNLGEGEGGSKV